MIVKPIRNINTAFFADNKTLDPKTGEYLDPLMHWPLRGAAFTNEIGEALRPIIGNYATLSWVPALLYIGADVYDKYKNDQTEYSPNSARCLKQAIFQGLASIVLPLVAVRAGQKLFSLFGNLSKNKLSFANEEKILKVAETFVANGNMRAYKNNDQECCNAFISMVKNNIDYQRNSGKVNIILKKYFDIKQQKKCENIEKYSENLIKDMIKMRKELLNPNEKFSNTKWYQSYKISMKNGQTKNVAVKSVLNKYLNDKTLKGKVVMTFGGFLSLGIAIKPIDHFVEKILSNNFFELKRKNKKEVA